jgi:4-diphosphocytidyl-2-C-methyl-D-erythritol kinase
MNRKTAIRSISLPAPAKVNLCLAVIGARPDGFHELVTLMAKIDLCDLVSLERTATKGEISCICEGADGLNGEKNLAWQAVDLWRQATGDETGIRITIKKRIPSMAGLGGGSSDAVATLKALNLWNLDPLPFDELREISSRLGSDCPSFLVDGACVATGRGEKARPLSIKANNRLHGKRLFLFKPPLGFSTASVYAGLSERQDAYSSRESADQKIGAWEKDEIGIHECMTNDLESVIMDKYCFVRPLFDTLSGHFGMVPMLSGSGSCCFAFVPDQCPVHKVIDCVKEAWGDGAFVSHQRIRS